MIIREVIQSPLLSARGVRSPPSALWLFLSPFYEMGYLAYNALMQHFQRPLRDMRDNTDSIRGNTDAIRSNVQDMHEAVINLNKTIKELPGQIQTVIVHEEKIAHDAYVLGAAQFGIWGIVIGLIFGLIISKCRR